MSENTADTTTNVAPAALPGPVPVPVPSQRNTVGLIPTWLAWVREGLSASVGLRVKSLPTEVSATTMATVWMLSSAALIGAERLRWDNASFSFSGWLVGRASLALLIAVVWFAMATARGPQQHRSPVASWLALYAVVIVPISFAAEAWYALVWRDGLPAWALLPWVQWGVFGGLLAWLAIAVARITQPLLRPGLSMVALVLGVVGVQWVSGVWLDASAWQAERSEEGEPETLQLSQEVFDAQEALLERALGQLTRRADAPVQVFGVVYAPFAQGVFLRESRMVADVLEQRMGHAGSVVTLLNHAQTTQEIPWATPRNLQRAVQRLAGVMDRENDVLVLYLTSHGGRDSQLVSSHAPLAVPALSAEQVRQWLDAAGVKYRAVVVSACYSGGWVGPMASPDTMVMTAAAHDKTSYGCGHDSDLTFFGKALFDEDLRRTLSWEDAFAAARPRILERETLAGKPDGPSDPQMRMGSGFKTHWDSWMNSRATASSAKP